MSEIEKICLIVDLEGFQLAARKGKPKEFVVRERGWCVWPGADAASCGSLHYYPTDKYRDLHLRDHRTVKYVTEQIHGLLYHPTQAEKARPPWQMYKDLEDLYKTHSTPERMMVAYKGGVVEKEVLSKLGIPSLDLEKVGCPKFDIMNRVTTMGSCSHHAHPLRHHCPKVECYHFMQWLQKTLHLTYDSHFVNLERVSHLL